MSEETQAAQHESINVPVLGIEEIVLEVEDLARSVAFYENVIGLPPFSRGTDEAWFHVGDQWLALFRKGREGGAGSHFAFRIRPEDVERAEQKMTQLGYPEKTLDYSGGRSVYVRDPDGNEIELHAKREEENI
jgi:catechol-2,3-dioxygenase